MRPLVLAVALDIVGFGAASASDLTIYNQDFALVRESLPLDLKAGINPVTHEGITAYLEPDSVMLRDPTGHHPFEIVEQSYRGDPVSQERLLSLYEGKTIEFLIPGEGPGGQRVATGKVLRSGFGGARPRGPGQPSGPAAASRSEPVIESEGKIRIGLPGVPLFPALTDEGLLKPRLDWLIRTEKAGRLAAELVYLTGGLNWKASYDAIAPEAGDDVEVVGWVTIENQSGRSFPEARVSLMAGELAKRPGEGPAVVGGVVGGATQGSGAPVVKETPFDDYHLYTLPNPISLPERDTKQVEFLRAARVGARRVYVYDGLKLEKSRYQSWNPEFLRSQSDFGTESSPRVWVMREFTNTAPNGLGVPLPKGNLRFYRKDAEGRLQFTGESEISHTPQGEMIRIFTGVAFDIVGERRRTEFQINNAGRTSDETFEISIRNRKKETADVRILEHLYRGYSWKIPIETDPHVKKDSQTVEFSVTIPAEGEKTVRYTVHYSW